MPNDFLFFLWCFSLRFFFLITDICPDIIPDVIPRETLIRLNEPTVWKNLKPLSRHCHKAKIA